MREEQERNASRNMSEWASPSGPRNEIAGLARIQTGHLATGWALETTRVIDVGWGRQREGEWNSTLSLAMTQAEVPGRWCLKTKAPGLARGRAGRG